MAVTNTTYRFLVEKLGGTDPATFVGNEGEVFYDPDASSPTLRLSDGSTAGGISVGGSGGSSVWSTSGSNIYYDSGNVGIGVNDPQVRLQLDGTLAFKTYSRYNATRTNILIGDATTGAAVANSFNANDNIYMGIGAGSSAEGGYNNFFGRYAGGDGGGGAFNNFIGYYAGYQNDYGANNNVFIGSGTGGYGPNQGSRNNFIGYYAGQANTTGSYNNFFGSGGLSNTTGQYNTFFGAYSGVNNTTGSYNNSFGQRAGNGNTTGSHNIYVGGFSGISTTASRKVIIGSGVNYNTLFDAPDTTKDTQLAIGVRTSSAPANYWIVGNEDFNVGIGTPNPEVRLQIDGVLGFGTFTSTHFQAFNPVTNIRIGDASTGPNLSTGYDNIFMGVGAGTYSDGRNNNFLGKLTGAGKTGIVDQLSITTSTVIPGNVRYYQNIIPTGGSGTGLLLRFTRNQAGVLSILTISNEGYGYQVGDLVSIDGSLVGGTSGVDDVTLTVNSVQYSTGSHNNFFGLKAGYSNSVGDNNTFIGYFSGSDNTSGSNNTFVGHYTGSRNTTGGSNTFLGTGVGTRNTTGEYNSFFGAYIVSFNGVTCTGSYNSVFGNFAGYELETASYNNIFGKGAGYGVREGNYNNFFGNYAGSHFRSPQNIGNGNAFFGNYSGQNNAGNYNNFFGYSTGASGVGNSGDYNSFFGSNSGENNTTGSYNTFFGYFSGKNNTTGANNIFLGNRNGISTVVSNKILIGSGYNNSNLFDAPDTTKDTQLAIGLRTSTSPSNYWIVGNENFNVGVGVTDPTSKLTVGGDIKAGTTASEGVILTDANGVAWRLTINTDGTLTTSAV